MALDSFNDLRSWCLERVGEDSTDTAGDLYGTNGFTNAMIEAWRWLWSAYPWTELITDPPGAFVTADDITTLTITVSSTGTSVAGTLSAAPSGSVSILGRKIRPGSVNWLARVTAHTAGEAGVTLDAVPATLAAGSAITIYQDEYDLAADLGLFVDGLWHQEGSFVPLWSQEKLKSAYPDPPNGALVPAAFCRLDRRKIKLSHYPTAIQRFEYPYSYEPADPSGTGALALPDFLRPVLAQRIVSILAEFKRDWTLVKVANERAEVGLQRAIEYEAKRVAGWGLRSRRRVAPAYSN